MSKIYSVKKKSPHSFHPDWTTADSLTDFSYPWNSGILPATVFRALWDSDYFYFRFDATDMNINVHKKSNDKLEVGLSDRVEIFFKSNEEMNPYYCLEIDPHGRVMDFEARLYRQFNFEWQWPNLVVTPKVLENGYSIEGKITLESLVSLNVLKNNTMHAGLYRANCIASHDDEAEFEWISWIHPRTENPDFHVASSFGKLILVQ
ncbi:MAG: carbohydrate-binding family 9-like protein [Bacteroidota bacterium]